MKKLKLRIAKFDHLLVVEQVERAGRFKESKHVFIYSDMYITESRVDLPENSKYTNAFFRTFNNNEKRDEYVKKIVNWITEEQFGGSGKLEIGKPCLVREDGTSWLKRIYAGEVAKQFGTEKRFLTRSSVSCDSFTRWKYAKPLNSAQPKIDGEIYTWEMD